MTAPNTFTPKQCPPRSPMALDAMQVDVTKQALEYALSLAPPITTESVVHDNGCGTGAGTEVILSKVEPAKLHATDLMPPYAEIVATKAAKNGWNTVETAAMNAMELSFPDNTFTHSISGFFIQAIPDPTKAVAEIYRTLQTGKTAIVTNWTVVPHVPAITKTNEAIRGKDAVMHVQIPEETHTAPWLENILKDAGFRSIYMEEFESHCRPDSLRDWCTYLWAFMGATKAATPGGVWTPKDEEDWDRAIDEFVKNLASDPAVTVNEDGSADVKMVAIVAIATK